MLRFEKSSLSALGSSWFNRDLCKSLRANDHLPSLTLVVYYRLGFSVTRTMDTTQEAESLGSHIGDANATSTFLNYDYNYSSDETMKLPLEQAVPVILIYVLVLLLGLTGNSLVIFSIAYYQRMRTTTNVFLLSLASADLLLIIVCVPVKAASLLTYSFTFGEVLCKLQNYVQNVSMICSVLTLTCISLERAFAVVFPLKARTVCTMRHAKIVVIVVWNLSSILAVPNIFAVKHFEVGHFQKGFWCRKRFTSRSLHILYEMYMFVLMFIIPIVVMVTTYIVICLRVWKFMDVRTEMRHGRIVAATNKGRIRPDTKCPESSLLNSSFEGEARMSRNGRNKDVGFEDSKTTKQLVIMLVVVVVFFAICWGPILIDNVLVPFGVTDELNYDFLYPMRTAFFAMSYFNSCVNPIVYAFLSKNFRQSFMFAICACVKGRAFVRAYRFSMSVASTRTSAVSSVRWRPGSAVNRDKSSSSGGNDGTQTTAHQDEDIMELRALPQTH